MIHMAWRTCVLLVPSKISPLSFHTTQKEPLTVDVRNPDFIICSDWFHCFRFCQWLISCIARQSTTTPWFAFDSLQITWLRPCFSCHTSWEISIRYVANSNIWRSAVALFGLNLLRISFLVFIFWSSSCVFWQPMHVGFTTDEGGNTIDLRWFRHKSNLHHVSLSTCSYTDLSNRQTRLPGKQKGSEKQSNIVWQEEKILLFLMSYVRIGWLPVKKQCMLC